tara:strand:- start:492 stop:743 length:252 start_codon:yes stop_codon:yes gene_type:complete
MTLQIQKDLNKTNESKKGSAQFNEQVFSKDYVDFLNEAGWILEKKLPSTTNNYSDLLEDTDWKTNKAVLKSLKHYRRDLDALS